MSQDAHSPNVYTRNAMTGATPNPLMPTPDAIDEEFAQHANVVLSGAVELVRKLIGVHQAAAAVVIQQDWRYVRKFFSLSEKYADWKAYDTAAVGYGIHAWLLRANHTVRLTQAELEAHPEWKDFGIEKGRHPPMRGWLATPIIDAQGVNWGLLQLSDKYEGDFTAEDEAHFVQFAQLVSGLLDARWEIRNLKKAGS